MKPLVLSAVLLLLASATLSAQSARRIDPKLTERLRTDLTTAIANASLSEAQTKTLRQAADALHAAGEARKTGRTVDRDAVKQAFADLKGMVESEALRPEDAKKIKADIDAIRSAMRQGAQPGRRRRPVAAGMTRGA